MKKYQKCGIIILVVILVFFVQISCNASQLIDCSKLNDTTQINIVINYFEIATICSNISSLHDLYYEILTKDFVYDSHGNIMELKEYINDNARYKKTQYQVINRKVKISGNKATVTCSENITFNLVKIHEEWKINKLIYRGVIL